MNDLGIKRVKIAPEEEGDFVGQNLKGVMRKVGKQLVVHHKVGYG
jgi:hypothetical protein